jgi:hypothetical protein
MVALNRSEHPAADAVVDVAAVRRNAKSDRTSRSSFQSSGMACLALSKG